MIPGMFLDFFLEMKKMDFCESKLSVNVYY